MRHAPENRIAEFEVGREPSGLEGKAGAVEVVEDILEVARNVVRQHEQVVKLSPPLNRTAFIRYLPEPGNECPYQQLLGETHSRMRRHFEAPQFQQSQAPRGGIR